MKAQSVRRVAFEAIILLAALGAAGYAGMIQMQLGDMEKETSSLKEQLVASDLRKQSDRQRMQELLLKEGQLEAAKAALGSGTLLADLEAAVTKAAAPAAEQQLALGGLRMLIKGTGDPGTLSSFQKALELVEWSKHLKMLCAAQIGIAASGQQIAILEECTRKPAAAPAVAQDTSAAPGAAGQAAAPIAAAQRGD